MSQHAHGRMSLFESAKVSACKGSASPSAGGVSVVIVERMAYSGKYTNIRAGAASCRAFGAPREYEGYEYSEHSGRRSSAAEYAVSSRALVEKTIRVPLLGAVAE